MKDSRGEHQTNAGIQQDYPTPKLLFALYQQQRQKSQLNHQGKKHPSKDLKASHLVEGEAAGGEGQRQGSRMVPSAGSGGDAQPRCQPGGQGASRCGGTAAAGEHTDTHTYTQGFVDVQSGRGKAAAATTVPEGPGRDFSAPCPSAGGGAHGSGDRPGAAPHSPPCGGCPGGFWSRGTTRGLNARGKSHPTTPAPLPYSESSSRPGAGAGAGAPLRAANEVRERGGQRSSHGERSGAERSRAPSAGHPPRPGPSPQPGRARGGQRGAPAPAERPHRAPRRGAASLLPLTARLTPCKGAESSAPKPG